MSLAAGLAFLLLFTGNIGQLGSDGFDFELSTVDLGDGRSMTLVKNPIRGLDGMALPGMTEDDIYEARQQIILREGTIKNIEGFSFDGGVPYWQITYVHNVNGELLSSVRDPIELSVANRPPSREMIPFMLNNLDGFMELIATGRIPARPYGTISSDGLTFQVQQWSKHYPDYGLFTFFRGEPIDPDKPSR